MPQFDDDIITEYLTKQNNNIDRTVEELFKIEIPTNSQISNVRSMFPQYSIDEVKSALMKAGKKPDSAIDFLLKNAPKKKEDKKVEVKKEEIKPEPEKAKMVKEMFPYISNDIIAAALVKAKNHLENTITDLLNYIPEDDKKAKSKGDSDKAEDRKSEKKDETIKDDKTEKKKDEVEKMVDDNKSKQGEENKKLDENKIIEENKKVEDKDKEVDVTKKTEDEKRVEDEKKIEEAKKIETKKNRRFKKN